MDFDQLKQILDLVREHELTEFEVEQDGLRLKIKKDALTAPVAVHQIVAAPAAPAVAQPGAPATAPVAQPPTGLPPSAPPTVSG